MTHIGKIVSHKKYSEGKIESMTQSEIIVHFPKFQRSVPFAYPQVFKMGMETREVDLIAQVNKDLRLYHKKMKQLEEEREMREAEKRSQEKEALNSNVQKTHFKRVNIAFKCNYCDGGKTKYQVGFSGICSEKMINYNVKEKKREWCSHPTCPCYQYLHDPYMKRANLERYYQKEGPFCSESEMLRDWTAYAGIYHNGSRKDEPMKLLNVQSQSLCVLTTRESRMEESDRYIFAVFLVNDFRVGDDVEQGYVSSNSEASDSEFRIKLSREEALEMPYWKYHANEKDSSKPAWSTGLHRYFDDVEAAMILRDVAVVKKGTKKEELAERFFHHFCRINHVDEKMLGQPEGALTKQSKNGL